MIKSSYLNDINYGDIIDTLTFLINPKKIVEIGILDGFSLSHFVKSSDKNCIIEAYDIFDQFVGNCANFDKTCDEFGKYDNVSIQYGDFYDVHNKIDDNSIDILHIDIANNGDVLLFTIDNYLKKVKLGGIIIFEGGSIERDNVYWMEKYDKPKIHPVLEKLKENELNFITIGSTPSITIIKK